MFFFHQEYWILNSPMQTTIILLVEQIVTALGGEFKVSWVQVIEFNMLRNKVVENRPITSGAVVYIKGLIDLEMSNHLTALFLLQIYLPQIIPQILKVFMHDSSPQRSVTTKVTFASLEFCSGRAFKLKEILLRADRLLAMGTALFSLKQQLSFRLWERQFCESRVISV